MLERHVAMMGLPKAPAPMESRTMACNSEPQSRLAGTRAAQLFGGVFGIFFLSIGLATVPVSNELGLSMKVLKGGATSTVELKFQPKRSFDSVTIEAASGVASLNSSCAFAHSGVIAGHSYTCQVDVSGKSSDAAMTVNVIGRRAVPGGVVPETEMHNLSIRNSGFAVAHKRASASHHDVAEQAILNK
jgi:hypothetical protein